MNITAEIRELSSVHHRRYPDGKTLLQSIRLSAKCCFPPLPHYRTTWKLSVFLVLLLEETKLGVWKLSVFLVLLPEETELGV